MGRIILVGVLLGAIALTGCASQSHVTSSSVSSSLASEMSSASSTSRAEKVDVADVITIPLDYSAGTGFEWTCAAKPENKVEQIDRTTIDRAEGQNVSGGSLQERFTFRAKAPGEVVLTFELARSWENGSPAETQVYTFSISDDLRMVLNPYKSDFINEPERA